jgi:hypothetical protein
MVTVRYHLGTLGLTLARKLYGAECIIDMGDWLSYGVAAIPQDDLTAFQELLDEEVARLGFNAPQTHEKNKQP